MISFTYKLTTYSAFLHDVAKALYAQIQHDIFYLPTELGEGFFRAIEFNDTDALFYEFKLKEDLAVKREKEDKEYYTLIYDELEQAENFALHIGAEPLADH